MLSNHLPIASEYGGENDRKHFFWGGMLLIGVLCGREDRWTDTPHRSSRCSGGHQAGTTICPMAFGAVAAPARCARQHLDGNLARGWRGSAARDASHRGNSHVKRDQTGQTGSWGPSCLHSPASLSGNSFQKKYIYKIKKLFYIYMSVFSLHGYLSPSLPTEARGPCPAPLMSSRGEAFLSVPSP